MKGKRLYIHEVGASNKRVVNNRVVSKSDLGRQGEKRRLTKILTRVYKNLT